MALGRATYVLMLMVMETVAVIIALDADASCMRDKSQFRSSAVFLEMTTWLCSWRVTSAVDRSILFLPTTPL